MKRISRNLPIAIVLLLAACSQNEVPVAPTNEPTTVEFSSVKPLALDPLTEEYLAKDSTVRVLVYKRVGSSANLESDIFMGQNTYYVSDTEGKLTACVVDANGKKIAGTAEKLQLIQGKYDFYAYTPALGITGVPAVGTAGGTKPTISVKNGNDYALSLTPNEQVYAASTSDPVQTIELATLQRQCAKIIFDIDKHDAVSAGSFNTVVINSATLSDMPNSTYTAKLGESMAGITPDPGNPLSIFEVLNKTNGSQTAYTGEMIVLPRAKQDMLLSMNIKFDTEAAATYTKTIPDVELEPGKEYTFIIRLIKDSILFELEVADWDGTISLTDDNVGA